MRSSQRAHRVRQAQQRSGCARRALFALLAVPLLAGCQWIRPYDIAQRPDIVTEVQQIHYAPAPTQALTLQDAIQLALDYNLDAAAKRLERDIQAEEASGAKLSLLPDLRLDFSQTRRSNERASRSMSFQTHQQSLEPSVSSERVSKTYGLHAVWNLIDFGLSYLRARQAEEEMRIRDLRYERLRQGLALDVTEAYWRVVVTKRAADQAGAILKRAGNRRAKIQQQIEQKVVAEVPGLEKEHTLAQMQVRLREQVREYETAVVELSKLMGLAPGTTYTLVDPKIEPTLALPETDVKELEAVALHNRPELAELTHREQIQRDEVEASILRMFPHISALFDREHDANKFLTHRTWHTIGIDATWSLLTLPQRWKQKKAAEKRVGLTQQKRMALAIGVLTQVRLAVLELRDAHEAYNDVQDLYSLQQRLLAATKKRAERQEADQSKVLEREADAFFAEVRFLNAYANLMVAHERLENTLGRNVPRPGTEELKQEDGPAAKDASQPVGVDDDPPETDSPAEVCSEDMEPLGEPIQSPAQIRDCKAVLFPRRLRRPHQTQQQAEAKPESAPPDRPTAEILFEPAPEANRSAAEEPKCVVPRRAQPEDRTVKPPQKPYRWDDATASAFPLLQRLPHLVLRPR